MYQGELWSGWQAGDGASTFSESIVRLWFKDEAPDAFLPSSLLVRSSTALGLISLKSVKSVAAVPGQNQFITTKEAIQNLEPKPFFQGRKQMRS